ncbi:ABC transporter ATP-binding protein [Lacticaseibacillus nasuensis]|uniref:ABC-2 type transport system ATP-binding protein n=1 Tax=Lacticaseibacillus nasuensis JCM 17158 TaxID=1291734 RepID=A0A0R1JPL5_9LACO|nr:ABC transporter ATP-binding protein [Lacticaseibacillus nasuensis]KRK70521.1 ABC-2 type transport system ATP-binding protein [Lacticaseibacillus nasuensis JCM 17158]
MTDLLQIEHLDYQRNYHRILTDINLTLPAGQIVGLLGANGAGKTTLMRLIAGVAPHFRGSITVAGATAIAARKAVVSYSALLAGAPANARLEQLALFCERLYPDFAFAHFQQLATEFALDCHAKLSTLSKGNQRKFTIALTLARRSQLYLLDEPFDGIDSMTRKKILAGIIQWKPDAATMVISDHHVGDIANLLDSVVIIKDQRIVAHERADTIRETHHQSIEDYYEALYEEAQS